MHKTLLNYSPGSGWGKERETLCPEAGRGTEGHKAPGAEGTGQSRAKEGSQGQSPLLCPGGRAAPCGGALHSKLGAPGHTGWWAGRGEARPGQMI